MTEYISREAAKQAARMAFARVHDAMQYTTMIHLIEKVPAADVRENAIRTQADRIRAMSDEALTGMFCRAETDGRAYGPRGKAYWLKWLQSSVGGD